MRCWKNTRGGHQTDSKRSPTGEKVLKSDTCHKDPQQTPPPPHKHAGAQPSSTIAFTSKNRKRQARVSRCKEFSDRGGRDAGRWDIKYRLREKKGGKITVATSLLWFLLFSRTKQNGKGKIEGERPKRDHRKVHSGVRGQVIGRAACKSSRNNRLPRDRGYSLADVSYPLGQEENQLGRRGTLTHQKKFGYIVEKHEPFGSGRRETPSKGCVGNRGARLGTL